MARPLRVLIDGMNAAHRFRHSLKELQTKRGVPTGVLFGFMQMLDTVLQMAPDEIIVAWDAPTTWRTAQHPGYKSTRKAARAAYTAEEQEAYAAFIQQQLPDTQAMLSGLGIPQVMVPQLEADDVIALLCKWGTLHSRCAVRVVSTDTDLIQLASRTGVGVLNPITDVLYTQCKKTGAVLASNKTEPIAPSPTVYLWRKAVVGDTSDDIAGVRGIGAVSAAQLLADRELPGETWSEYAERHKPLWKGKRGNDLLLASGAMYNNLILMDLTGLYARPGVARIFEDGYRDALRAVAKVYRENVDAICPVGNVKALQPLPVFLRGGLHMDPSPFLSFFRKFEFEFAYNPANAGEVKRKYKRLWEHRSAARALDAFCAKKASNE